MATLTPERWQQVSPFLDRALSRSDAERKLRLESFRAEKPELADLLLELLEEHRELADKQFLEDWHCTNLSVWTKQPVTPNADMRWLSRKKILS